MLNKFNLIQKSFKMKLMGVYHLSIRDDEK